jgi:hypothetical protein
MPNNLKNTIYVNSSTLNVINSEKINTKELTAAHIVADSIDIKDSTTHSFTPKDIVAETVTVKKELVVQDKILLNKGSSLGHQVLNKSYSAGSYELHLDTYDTFDTAGIVTMTLINSNNKTQQILVYLFFKTSEKSTWTALGSQNDSISNTLSLNSKDTILDIECVENCNLKINSLKLL